MRDFGIALRLLRGDWHQGELRVLAAALALAVASVGAVGLFADRVARGLAEQSDRLLGADLMVSGDHPLPAEFASEAHAMGLATTPVVRFNSMIQRGDGGPAVLTDVKAVAAGYPLLGTIRLAPLEGDAAPATGRTLRAMAAASPEPGGSIPKPGTVWIDRQLARRLDAQVGARLAVGEVSLAVTAIYQGEPEVAGAVFAPSPKLLVNAADLPATQLIEPGTRASFRLMVAAHGEPAALQHYRSWLEGVITAGERVDTAGDLRPELRQALERAGRFLGLASLASVLLAAAAVALSVGRYLRRHLDLAAMLRCFGAPASRILGLFLVQFAVVGIAASVAGMIVAAAAQQAIVVLLAAGDSTPLPWPSWTPVFEAAGTALVLLAGFALPPLVALAREPPLRVLRRDLPLRGTGGRMIWSLAIAAIAALIGWQARAVESSWLIVAAVLGLLLAAMVVGRLLLLATTHLPGRAAMRRFGIANLRRRPLASSLQIGALALGAMALLLLAVVRADLLADWRAALPPDAPNRFLVNILPDQRGGVRDFVARSIAVTPTLEPMVRGRLVEKNGAALEAAHSADPRTRQLARREFNLSWTDRLPPANQVVAGQFWDRDARGTAAGVSFEEGIAKRLGVKIGDRLVFDSGGVRVAAVVTSLRKVEWDSFHVNFFALLAPGALDLLPATWITAFKAPQGEDRWSAALVRQFPNVLVIDVTEILAEIEEVIGRVAHAVEFVFLFTLAAGLLVLEAAIVSTLDERQRDAAVLRALGASTRQLRTALVIEFALIGAVAGVLAAIGATAVGHLLASEVFDVPFRGSADLWLYAVAGGAVLVAAAGWLGVRGATRASPLVALRALD